MSLTLRNIPDKQARQSAQHHNNQKGRAMADKLNFIRRPAAAVHSPPDHQRSGPKKEWTMKRKTRSSDGTPTQCRRFVGTALGLILATVGLGTLSHTPAHAAPEKASIAKVTTSPQIHSGAALRYCINTALSGCQKAGTFAGGRVSMICWRDGSTATGAYKSNRWFYVTQGTRKGWAHSSWVTRQKTVPNCSTHRGVSMATWAAARHREIYASPTYAAWMWPGEADRRWSGGCSGLTSASLKFGFGANPRYRGNARPQYEAYRSAGKVRSMSSPPSVGAVIFWPNSTSLGHTATYLGNGIVQSTQGYLGQTLPNYRVSLSTFGTPAGWVSPGDF